MAKILKDETHEHVFQRLSEAAIFCACGEIVAAPPLATPACCHGFHCYHWPNVYPTWQPTVTYPNWTISSTGTAPHLPSGLTVWNGTTGASPTE